MSVQSVSGVEHWAKKGDVNLFLWEKRTSAARPRGRILFVHGSSMGSLPSFDLQTPGYVSPMDYFAAQGFDCWTVDMEGYGRSGKERDIDATVSEGAADLKVATDYIFGLRGPEPFHMYGISSGALRAALFAQNHPDRVARLALDAHVWTGKGSPTLAARRKRLPEMTKHRRRPIDRAFVRSIFERDHPGTADDHIIEAFADAILAQDDSMPNGTYIDMCLNLPVVDPVKIKVPTLIMRGEYDGIASLEDLIEFFELLPNPDKQFAMMPGMAHASFHSKNHALAYHMLLSFLTQPPPVYRTYKEH